jgi:hypothetical protein
MNGESLLPAVRAHATGSPERMFVSLNPTADGHQPCSRKVRAIAKPRLPNAPVTTTQRRREELGVMIASLQ